MKRTKMNSTTSSLILALVFTIVNILFFILGFDVYFLFSIFVPYVIPIIFSETALYTIAIIVSVVILLIYGGMVLLSKKHISGYIVSLVLYIIDTIALVFMTMSLGEPTQFIFDYIFHAWIIWILITGIRDYNKSIEPIVDTSSDIEVTEVNHNSEENK